MFKNRMKHIFTDFVDNGKGIFDKINNNEEVLDTKFTRIDNLKNYEGDIYLDVNEFLYLSGGSFRLLTFARYKNINYLNDERRDFTISISLSSSIGTNPPYTSFSNSYLTLSDIMGGFSNTSITIPNSQLPSIINFNNKTYLRYTFSWQKLLAIQSYGTLIGELVSISGIYKMEFIPSSKYAWYTHTLDFEYIYSHSGDKLISPFVEKLLDNDNNLSETNLEKIANVIKNKFVDKWNKLFNALVEVGYNPIDNYNMNEVETPNIERTSHVETNTNITTSGEGDNNSKVYAFNSDNAIPSNEGHAETSQTSSGSVDDNYSDRTENETGTRELVRSGNIGVTTTQQMLQQEIEIKKQNIYNIIYEDVDSLLCLDIY